MSPIPGSHAEIPGNSRRVVLALACGLPLLFQAVGCGGCEGPGGGGDADPGVVPGSQKGVGDAPKPGQAEVSTPAPAEPEQPKISVPPGEEPIDPDPFSDPSSS